jgi:hypothetical protein
MRQMQPWVTMVAAVACVTLPVIGSAGEDTRISPEAHSTPTSPTPGLVAVPLGAGGHHGARADE